MNGLDLFSGIGGMSLALREWMRPLAYCEIDPYCQAVLLSRMASGELYVAPIWDDIRSFQNPLARRTCDIIYGGFPCQDISIAGNGKGLAGKRSGLFYEILRLCSEIKPRFIFLENVPAITTRGGTEVVREITKMGYDCRWVTITTSSVGALHKRERWFLLAHAKGERFKEGGFPLREEKTQPRPDSITKYEIWGKEPENKFELVRVANGISRRVDRLRALGNSVVPQQVKKAFEILMGLK